MTVSTDTPPEPRTHHKGWADERHPVSRCHFVFCGLDRRNVDSYVAGQPLEPTPPPETPIERLRRLADPKTRNVPAEVILGAVVTVVNGLTDEVAAQRRQIAEQRAWIDDAARGFLRRTVEDAVNHNRPKPIPTPNRPDQTPTEQRPEAVLKPSRCDCDPGPEGQHQPYCVEYLN